MFWNKTRSAKKKLKDLEGQILSLYVVCIMQLPHERFVKLAETMSDKDTSFLIAEMKLLLRECFEDKYRNRIRRSNHQEEESAERIAELEAELHQKQIYIKALTLENSKLKTTVEVMGDYCDELLEGQDESV